MKKKIAFFLALAFFLQFSFLSFAFPSLEINLLLVFAFLLLRVKEENFKQNLLWLAGGGILLDVFSVYPFGTGIASFLIMAFAMQLYLKIVPSDDKNILPDIPMLFLVKVVFEGTFFLLNKTLFLLGIGREINLVRLSWANYFFQTFVFIIITLLFLAYLLKRKRLQKNEIRLS